MISILDAQQDMRVAYYGGGPGVIVSGSVWLIAGCVAFLISPNAGMLALIFGGMAIFPASVLLCKIIGAAGKHQKENPLAPLALEGTFWMLITIPVAIGAAFYKIEWFFPAMLFVIAGRYLTFSTLYGNRLYWALAAALFIAGWGLLSSEAPAFSGAFIGGVIECCFGAVLIRGHRNSFQTTQP